MKTIGFSFALSPIRKTAVVCSLLYIACGHPAAAAGDFEEAVAKGNVQVKARQYDKAVKEYEKALQIKPDDGKIYYQRALAYQKKGNVAEAQSDLLNAGLAGNSGR